MENVKRIKIFKIYIKERIKIISLFFFFTLVFSVVFFLYGILFDAVIYAFLLCLFAGILISIIDFTRFYRKVVQFEEFKMRALLELDIPESKRYFEKEYQQLLISLFDEKQKLQNLSFNKQRETVDYYTMWVHQIKTPIAAMRLLLQSNQEIDKSKLKAELFRIEQYVQMVLSYLRIDAPNDFVIQRYELNEIIRQAVRKYASLFIAKKITLDLSEINQKVLTDEKWLVFVIEQLLSNAIKYTGKGGRIKIYLKEKNKLIIEDNGIGIAEDDLPRLGEKGFTGYNGREQKQASGLGIYLCKKILHRLSHSISFTSEIGKGTKVLINFETISFLHE